MIGTKKKFPLHYQILAALVSGFVFGYFFPVFTGYTNWVGVIFLRALNMVVIPLILCSIITGVSSIEKGGQLGKLALKTIGYYVFTTLLAILTGFILVYYIKPGVGLSLNGGTSTAKIDIGTDKLSDTLLNIIPKNIFESLTSGHMLAIIFFAILFGYFITRSEAKTQTILKDFFASLLDVIMRITMFVIKLAPFGIFSIAAREIAKQVELGNDVTNLFRSLGLFVLIVIAGILFHGLITLSITLKYMGNINPLKHLKNMATPLLTAFSTTSSNATLPLTIEAVEKNNGVSTRIAGFTLPLGATVNMNGTALYECVAVIFIAQVYGIELTFIQQVIVIFTALLAAVGAAGVPMAAFVMMVVILKTVGLPIEGIGLILPVDRILDMFRTSLNVYGDTCAATIIAKSEGEKLKV
jgi:Na+/H+-dicarboxylate symporter